MVCLFTEREKLTSGSKESLLLMIDCVAIYHIYHYLIIFTCLAALMFSKC